MQSRRNRIEKEILFHFSIPLSKISRFVILLAKCPNRKSLRSNSRRIRGANNETNNETKNKKQTLLLTREYTLTFGIYYNRKSFQTSTV